MGKLANEVRDALETALARAHQDLAREEQERKLAREKVDISLPGRKPQRGAVHPLNHVRRRIEDIFLGMGYTIEEGPEIESDYYNFVALNLPRHHPARDMQDTFYIDEETVLRTHTSPVQVRTMEKMCPAPLKMICPGKVYRKDDDATHSPMFFQIEGLVIDKGITLADLKVVLLFAREMFGPSNRFACGPAISPEPSAEVDILYTCNGKGCRMCADTGWLEILGPGWFIPGAGDVQVRLQPGFRLCLWHGHRPGGNVTLWNH